MATKESELNIDENLPTVLVSPRLDFWSRYPTSLYQCAGRVRRQPEENDTLRQIISLIDTDNKSSEASLAALESRKAFYVRGHGHTMLIPALADRACDVISDYMRMLFATGRMQKLLSTFCRYYIEYGQSCVPMLVPVVDYGSLSTQFQISIAIGQNPLYCLWQHIEREQQCGWKKQQQDTVSICNSTQKLSDFHEVSLCCDLSGKHVDHFSEFDLICRVNKRCWFQLSQLHQLGAFFTNSADRQDVVCRVWSWAVPSPDALDYIKRMDRPVVEVGAGTGYWLSQLYARGVTRLKGYDVVGNTLTTIPDLTWTTTMVILAAHATTTKTTTSCFYPVHEATPSTINWESHCKDVLLLCWPPEDSHPGASMSVDALESFLGDDVIYVGEGRGGSTATDAFFDRLSQAWLCTTTIPIPVWPGVYDMMYHYRRRTLSNM